MFRFISKGYDEIVNIFWNALANIELRWEKNWMIGLEKNLFRFAEFSLIRSTSIRPAKKSAAVVFPISGPEFAIIPIAEESYTIR